MINLIKKILRHLRAIKTFPNSVIHYGATLDKTSIVGKNTVIFPNVILQNCEIGAYSYIQINSVLSSTKVGKFCSIASNVNIGLANHPIDKVSTSPVFYDNSQPLPFFFTSKKEIEHELITTISSDVWIGQGVIIKSGVNIGVGAIIGAGSVVTKDVKPYSIVGGVPAKHIKYRFSDSICKELVVSKWWEIDDLKMKEVSNYFNDPELLIKFIKEELNK